jgi:hypothetical protein
MIEIEVTAMIVIGTLLIGSLALPAFCSTMHHRSLTAVHLDSPNAGFWSFIPTSQGSSSHQFKDSKYNQYKRLLRITRFSKRVFDSYSTGHCQLRKTTIVGVHYCPSIYRGNTIFVRKTNLIK